MDEYTFEDFIRKPFKYEGKSKVPVGLNFENALYCLLYIYSCHWNSQDIANILISTGIWRGLVTLIIFFYFIALPVIIMCLYLGKFLNKGVMSLYNCNPCLFGVGALSLIFIIPFTAKMVSFPYAENLLFSWVVHYGSNYQPCSKMILESNGPKRVCIENKDEYTCCMQGQYPGYDDCEQPVYSAYIAYGDIVYSCQDVSLFEVPECECWLLLVIIICILVLFLDIPGFLKFMVFLDKFNLFILYLFCWWGLMHLDVVVISFYNYIVSHEATEGLIYSLFQVVTLELDNLSLVIPFLLLMGRFLDDDVSVPRLAIRLLIEKIVRLFFLANQYVLVINILASYYGVKYECIHNPTITVTIPLAVIPQLFIESSDQMFKYPALFLYLLEITLKKTAALVLYGNLIYHNFVPPVFEGEIKKQISKYRKAINILIKSAVFIILIACYRYINLKVWTHYIYWVFYFFGQQVLPMQLLVFSLLITHIGYNLERFRSDVEGLIRKKMWPEMLQRMNILPYFLTVVTVGRLIFYYIDMTDDTEEPDILELTSIKAPLYYVAALFLITFPLIIINTVINRDSRILQISDDWAPVRLHNNWKIKPYNPGRKLEFYQSYNLKNHICVVDCPSIRESSLKKFSMVNLFSERWPCVFETKKYENFPDDVEILIKDAYSWGILAKVEEEDD